MVYPKSTALARDTTTVPWKKWSEYTDREKYALRSRWTEAKKEEVAETLREGKPMPDYVPLFPRDESLTRHGLDLRRIRLPGQDLDSAWLARSCLQGAVLLETSLQGAHLGAADLEGAQLWDAKLQGAYLHKANLEEAILGRAELHGADLVSANLRYASLYLAKLQGANLRYAGLQGATLRFAQLQRAKLTEADLSDVDLYGATFDSTYLSRVNLGAAKNIRFVIWGDKVKPRYIIGEEVKIGSLDQAIHSLKRVIHSLQLAADSLRTMKDRPAMTIDSLDSRIIDAVRERASTVRFRRDAFLRAELTYRDLKTFYKKELLDDVAMEFHFRENEVKTKGSPWHVRPFRVLFLRWTYGYGSRPAWLLWYSLAVVGLFSLIFTLLTIPRKTGSGIYLTRPGSDQEDELLPFRKGRLFLDCFYFSLLSFATFGYGALQPRQWIQFFRLEAVEYKPVRWARIFVGIEAALGIWVFALLVTVLFGK